MVLHFEMSDLTAHDVGVSKLFSSTVSAEFLLSEDGGQNIVISDAFIKGKTTQFLFFFFLLLPWISFYYTDKQITALIQTRFFFFCRVSVQPPCGGKSQRDAVHPTWLAPQLFGPAQRGEWREEGHGTAAVC